MADPIKPYTPVLEEFRPFLNYEQIRFNLRIPIDNRYISTKTVKGNSIAYVNITDLKDILDRRAGIWTSEVKTAIQFGNEVLIVVKITIHAVDGQYSQEGTGVEGVDHSGYGDSASNAYAQAFRRACEGHGLGRELWRKKDSNLRFQQSQQTQQNKYLQQPQVQNVETVSDDEFPPKEDADEVKQQRKQNPVNSEKSNQSKPKNESQPQSSNRKFYSKFDPEKDEPRSKSLADLITQKQLNFIKSLATEKNVDPSEYCQAMVGCLEDELNKKSAAYIIEALQELPKE